MLCSLLLNFTKVYFESSLIAKPNVNIEVCPSYDPSCVIFSCFNFMVIFNIASAAIAESQMMLF